jgi:CRP-like cAMP-binding protein
MLAGDGAPGADVFARKAPASAAWLKVPWLHFLDPSTQKAVLSESYVRSYDKGALVARQGEPASSWIGVIEGMLKGTRVNRNGKVAMVTGVTRDGWIVEGSLGEHEMRHYNLAAMTDSQVMHIPSSAIHHLLDTNTRFSRYVIDELSKRLWQYLGMAETARTALPEARLALAIAHMFNPAFDPGVQAFLPFSQAELSEFVGLSRQRTNEAIQRLKRAGVLAVHWRGLIVEDWSRLKAFACGAA